MNENKMPIHSDLHDSANQIVTANYCCPIFITPSFGVALSAPNHLIEGSEASPRVRSGTLTLVSYNGEYYGLTCRHVVEELEAQDRQKMNKLKELGITVFPPEGLAYFFFPKGDYQIHINAHFHKAPGDEYTASSPDIAFGRIPTETFEMIGRNALPLDRFSNLEEVMIGNFTGIATGYPENTRRHIPDKKADHLGVSTVIATAPLDGSTSRLKMISELDTSPDADNLSGMSGGPVIWSDQKSWGVAGIIKEGRDIKPKEGEDQIINKDCIWIDGEPITRETLINFLDSIPNDEVQMRCHTKKLIYG